MELEIENTEVVSSNEIQVEVPTSIEIEEGKKDYEVSVVKKEYTIIGDCIFIPSMYEDAPPWLKELIDTTINVAIINRDQSLIDKLRAILTALDYVPKNQYTEQINQIIGEDGIINSKIATLNSNFVGAINTTNATIAEIKLTYASKDEAAAIASNVLTASLSGSGEIGSALMQLQRAYASLEESTAEYLTILDASFGELVSGTTEQINTIRAYADGIESKFAYNSNLVVNGVTYKSGFGIASSLNDVEGIPVGESEFWINADKFRLTSASSNTKSAYIPFAVDTNTGDITFKGKVLIEGMPEEINKHLGGFISIAELNTYLTSNPEIVVNEGDTYHNSTENVMYFWNGNSWISAESELILRSLVFKRSKIQPNIPEGGNYSNPIPTTEGWEDGIPSPSFSSGQSWNNVAVDPVWVSYCEFSNKIDYVVNPPVWTSPEIMADTPTSDVMFNNSLTPPTSPQYTGDILEVQPIDSANGWYNIANANAVWTAQRRKNAGEWTPWYVYKVKGENGEKGASGSDGANGRRGSLVGRGSSTSWPSGSTLNNLIMNIPGSESRVYAGDTVIWTNTSTSGGTEIYEYNGSSWSFNTALNVNGNAVISGTLYSDRIMAGHIGSAVTALASNTITATAAHPNENWTGGTTVGSITYTNSSSSYASILILVAGRTGFRGDQTSGSCSFKIFMESSEIYRYGWSPADQDSKSFATTVVMPPKSTRTFYLKAVKNSFDASLYELSAHLQISIIGVANGG